MAGESDDDILRAYSTVPVARSYPAPKPLSKEEQDLLHLYSSGGEEPPNAKKDGVKPLEAKQDDGPLMSGAKNVATGVIKGLSDIPGFVGNAKNFGGYLADRAISAVSGTPLEEVQARAAQIEAARKANPTILSQAQTATDPGNVMPSGDDISGPVLARSGEYVPETEAGKMAQTGVRTVFGAVAPGAKGGGSVMSAVKAAPVMAASGFVGQGVSDATGDPLLGAAAGMAVPAGASALRVGGNKLMGTVSPEAATLADAATNKYGIPLGPGNISDSQAVRFLDSVVGKLPFSGGEKTRVAQQDAYNRAVGNTFGAPENKLTTGVMAAARDRIGADFDFVAQNTKMAPDQPMAADFAKVVKETKLAPAGVEDRIMKNIQEVADQIKRNGGQIPYQDLTRVGSPNGRGAGVVQKLINDPDPHVREAGVGLRNALDDALQRQAPPELVQTLQTARQQWRNMRTVEDLVPKGSPGDITPALLQGRVNAKNKGTYGAAYGGGGDLAELGSIGQRFLKEPPSSGSAERNLLHYGLFSGANAVGNMLVNPSAPNIAMTVGAPLAGLAVGRGANALLRNQNLARGIVDRSLGVKPTYGGNKLLNLPVMAPQPPVIDNRR